MSIPPLLETRIARFRRLEAAVRAGDDRDRPGELFQLLWGLPAALQFGLPLTSIRDALPEFLPSGHFDHAPALLNRIELLSASVGAESKLDPALWLGRSCDPMLWGEAALCFAIADLCDAVNARWCLETLTSGSVTSTMGVITARETLAFRRSDPAGAQEYEAFVDRGRAHLPLDPNRVPQRTPEKDPTARAERAAGWQRVVDWLRTADLLSYPEIVDQDRLLAALERWNHEGGTLTPRRSGG